MEEEEIPFVPSDVDVVSTKLRTWNLKHPGNLFYTNLVQQRLMEFSTTNNAGARKIAGEIITIILDKRGGRFLKLRDGDWEPTHCTVMDRKQSHAKVIHALRTAQAKMEGKPRRGNGASSASTKRKRTKQSPKPAKSRDPTDRKSVSPRPRARRPAANVESSPFLYTVTPSKEQPIHQYTLDAIAAVCNQSTPLTAFRVLDKPVGSYTVETEPDKERLMRLGLRLRFAAAAKIKMGAIEFATKLLKLWGAKLTVVKKERSAKPESAERRTSTASDIQPTPSAQTPATNDSTSPLEGSNQALTPEVQGTATPSTGGLPGMYPPNNNTPMSEESLPTPKVLASD